METGFGDDQIAEKNFPLNAPPVHWLYPQKGEFQHVFRLYAYQPTKWLGVNGEMTQSIHMVDMVVDLVTGRTLYQGGPIGVWSDVTADGLSTLQQGGSYITRPLLAVREDMAERLLVNRTNSTDIFTHNVGGTPTGLETKLQNGTDLSEGYRRPLERHHDELRRQRPRGFPAARNRRAFLRARGLPIL